MSREEFLVTLFFLLPGFLAMSFYEWLVVRRERSLFEMTTWAVGLSFFGLLPLVALKSTRPLFAYLWKANEFSEHVVFAVGLHVTTAMVMAGVAALMVTRVLRGQIRGTSFYERAWDWLWLSFGQESRYLTIRTERELFFGVLAFADAPHVGHGIVLRDPAVWVESKRDFYRSGMKYLYIPGEQVKHIEMSVAEPLAKADEPYYGSGYLKTKGALP